MRSTRGENRTDTGLHRTEADERKNETRNEKHGTKWRRKQSVQPTVTEATGIPPVIIISHP